MARLPDLHSPRGVLWLRRSAATVLVAGLVACAGESGSRPADPTLLPSGVTQGPVTTAAPGGVTTSGDGATTVERTPLPGFDDVVVEVHRTDGQVVSWCLLLAATSAQRERGLMEVTDPTLGGYDGMLFRFDTDTNASFWMRNTPQPLSIAYVAADGSTVSSTEMAPCEDSPDCPPYPSGGAYRWAVEVPVDAGGVARLGLPEGRLVDTGNPC
jgi:uncharacterized membrane protein (UPF0127 family)